VASTTQKKSSTTKSKSKAKSTSRNTAAFRAKKASQKRPVRREVAGIVLLVLALCTIVSYFKVSAILLDWLALFLKGLFGYGYWMAGPAMLIAGVILLFHRGRPVWLRVICTLLLPLMFGSLVHVLRCKEVFDSSLGILGKLWATGKSLAAGGVLSGLLAVGAVKLLSKVVSVVIFLIVTLVLLMVAFHVTLGSLVERHKARPRYEEEPEKPLFPELPKRKGEEAKEKPARIDFPLDEEPIQIAPAPAKKEGRFTSFFRHKSDAQKTPDQVLIGGEEEKSAVRKKPLPPAIPAEEPIVQPEPADAPAAEPILPVEPVKPAVAAPAPAPLPLQEEPSARKEKATTAKEVAAQTAAVTSEIQQKLEAEESLYQFPPITLLKAGQAGNHIEAGAELRNNSRRLAETLTSFGVNATPADVIRGPSVTRYEFVLEQGVKLAKITNLADDIALALGATGVRIAPIPDKISVVGIEVPNKQVSPVLIRDVVESRTFAEHRSDVAFAVGKDIGGNFIVGDIGKLPHVLIAGTTGSGKSVCTNSLIISLLYKSTPDEVRFIMVDPKMVELAPYNGIPHLLIPVVTDPKKAAGALQWAVFEMMKRYKTFSEHGVKKLEEYNRLARASEDLKTMPSVVVVIDELADLMLVAAKEVEESICRVAQMGRAAGMHLVIATQRPSADVITGLMKANIPSRIAFAVASSLESRIILDTTGAEKLVGKGDMLYAPLGESKVRVQGCFISPEEIEDVVSFVKQSGEVEYNKEVMDTIEKAMQEKEKGSGKGASAAAEPASEDEGDELLPAAVEVVLETGQASVSMLQRRLKLGYSRAARLVDQMEERGIVGPFEGSKPRQLLITRAQWQEMQMGGVSAAESTDETVLSPGEDA